LNSTYPHCSAYVALGFSNLAIDNPDKPALGQDERSAVIMYSLQSYYLQFWTHSRFTPELGSDSSWGNCTNRTTASGSSLRLCLGGGNGSATGNHSTITAGWHFCYDNKNCTPIVRTTANGDERYNNTVFTTTLFIQKVKSTVIVSPKNGTIFDIEMDKSTLHETTVDVQTLFDAFTAPLYYVPANITRLLQSDYVQDLANFPDIFDPIDLHSSEAKAEPLVNSLVYSFQSPLPNESPAQHLCGFLAHALVRNSAFVKNGTILRDDAHQTYILSIGLRGIIVYVAFNGIAIVLSFCMGMRRPEIKADLRLCPTLPEDNRREAIIEMLTDNTFPVGTGNFGDYQFELRSSNINNERTWQARINRD
jgi:hypothetical protein